MEFKQIKEDWRVYKPNVTRPSVIIVSGDNGCTDIYSAPNTNCTIEKAHLIAAAPDLYEVVRKALPLLKRSGYEIISIDAEYALKKALGEKF
mgnify:FL=1